MKNIKDFFSEPLNWSNSKVSVECGNYCIQLEREDIKADPYFYKVSIQVTSLRCSLYVKEIQKIKKDLPNCPKIRSAANADSILIGRVEKLVVIPRVKIPIEKLEETDPEYYKLGGFLINEGFSSIYEKSLSNYLQVLIQSLNYDVSNEDSYLINGVVNRNLVNFDPFYIFMFIYFDSGVSVNNAFDYINGSGLNKKYPPNFFNPKSITSNELVLLKEAYDRSRGQSA